MRRNLRGISGDSVFEHNGLRGIWKRQGYFFLNCSKKIGVAIGGKDCGFYKGEVW